MRDGLKLLVEWASGHYLTNTTPIDKIREIVGGDWSDDDLAMLRDLAIDRVHQTKVDAARAAMDTLTSLLNRGDMDALRQGMMGQHPYLLNELVWTLFQVVQKQCGRDGSWDGRITHTLAKFIDEYCVPVRD